MKVRFLRRSVRVYIVYSLLNHIPYYIRQCLYAMAYDSEPAAEGLHLRFSRDGWDRIAPSVYHVLNPIFPIVLAN